TPSTLRPSFRASARARAIALPCRTSLVEVRPRPGVLWHRRGTICLPVTLYRTRTSAEGWQRMTHHLVGIGEIAQILGVSRQRADQIAASYRDFPLPVVHLLSGRVWKRADVDAWVRKHPSRPRGRPK